MAESIMYAIGVGVCLLIIGFSLLFLIKTKNPSEDGIVFALFAILVSIIVAIILGNIGFDKRDQELVRREVKEYLIESENPILIEDSDPKGGGIITWYSQDYDRCQAVLRKGVDNWVMFERECEEGKILGSSDGEG